MIDRPPPKTPEERIHDCPSDCPGNVGVVNCPLCPAGEAHDDEETSTCTFRGGIHCEIARLRKAVEPTNEQEWWAAVNKALLESQGRLATQLRKVHEMAEWVKDEDEATMRSALAEIAGMAIADKGPIGRMEKMEGALKAIVELFSDREHFVMLGARAYMQVEQLARGALEGEDNDDGT